MKSIVYEMVDEDKHMFFKEGVPMVVLYLDFSEKLQDYAVVFEKVARKYKDTHTFAISMRNPGFQKNMAEFFGVQLSDFPAVRLIHQGEKYQFKHENVKKMTIKELSGFIEAAVDGSLESYRKS